MSCEYLYMGRKYINIANVIRLFKNKKDIWVCARCRNHVIAFNIIRISNILYSFKSCDNTHGGGTILKQPL